MSHGKMSHWKKLFICTPESALCTYNCCDYLYFHCNCLKSIILHCIEMQSCVLWLTFLRKENVI